MSQTYHCAEVEQLRAEVLISTSTCWSLAVLHFITVVHNNLKQIRCDLLKNILHLLHSAIKCINHAFCTHLLTLNTAANQRVWKVVLLFQPITALFQ